MGRRRWQGNKEQEKLLTTLVDEGEKVRVHDANVWAYAQKARELGVPDTVICQRADLSRTTLQRRLGPRPTDPGE